MIYLDNSATTLAKPPAVGEAFLDALGRFGNAGRSFHAPAMEAGRGVYKARQAVAALTDLEDPLQVAFTSSATESLNLVIGGLIRREHAVITTVLEHNSVLRPLYHTGCRVDVLGCDDTGRLNLESLPNLLRPETAFMVCTHGSNVTGYVPDMAAIAAFCREHGLTLIVDISQTLGVTPVAASMGDVLCFTGHKGLFGPQGTGGIIVHTPGLPFRPVKTGGAGANSFAHCQSLDMPEVFEVGTLNAQGIYALSKGVEFVMDTGLGTISRHEQALRQQFYDGVYALPGITIYGDNSSHFPLPVVSLNLEGFTSQDLSQRLWEEFHIATRGGIHCAPLLHQHFGTENRGMVRFSFSYFTTAQEVERAVAAIKTIVKGR